MSDNAPHSVFTRGQRVDLHISTIRDKAENTYGPMFAEAVQFRHKLDDPNFPDYEYEAAVVGLVCGTITQVRSLPPLAREGLGGLLSLAPEKRAQMMKIPAINDTRSFSERADRIISEIVIDGLSYGLYPEGSYVGGLTDIASGLEGLRLTFRRDILAEADTTGRISLQGLHAIRAKLASAVTEPLTFSRPVIVGAAANAGASADDEWIRKSVERRYKLIEVVEHAVSIGSPLQCIPSHIREDRIAEAYRSQRQKLAS